MYVIADRRTTLLSTVYFICLIWKFHCPDLLITHDLAILYDVQVTIFLCQVILYFIAYIIMSSVSGFVFEKWGIKKAVSEVKTQNAK